METCDNVWIGIMCERTIVRTLWERDEYQPVNVATINYIQCVKDILVFGIC